MPEQKTKPTEVSVQSFLDNVSDEGVRDDCQELIKIMKNITGEPPKMWGRSIVGFGEYYYKYESGHEGYSCLTGFSPRKQNLSLYVMPGVAEKTDLLEKFGKHKAAKGCLYIKRLGDIDIEILKKLIKATVDQLKKKYP
jgi:hypothetical protein